MTPTCIVITGADAGFFDLVKGCIQSVRDKAHGQRIPIAFLDLGCTEEQIGWLKTRVDFIRQPDWEFNFPGRESAPGHLKGLLSRPFLRKYFPGYDVYFWIDADAWIQDWQAVSLFVQGATERRGLAIVPEIDRASPVQYGQLPICWSRVQNHYADFFGADIAATYCSYPLLNAGVFALHQHAPHWKAWEDCLNQALARKCDMLADQMALNLAVYERGLLNHTELLPLWCNWTWNIAMPYWDEARRCLVEPYLPHIAIGILHMTLAKYTLCRLRTTKQTEVNISVRYPAGPLAPSVPPGEPVEMERALRQSLQQQPNDAVLQNNLGNTLARQGKLQDAEVCFRRALQIKPNLAEAHSNLANILGLQGNLDEAVASYRQALRLRPDFADAHCHLGQALGLQGKLDEAVASYRQALRLRPDFAEARKHLADALAAKAKSVQSGSTTKPDVAPLLPTPASPPAEVDYVSPGFATVCPDRFFPHMVVGDKSLCSDPYLRRTIPHRWYVDRRNPSLGFLNRDEAHILYNTALKVRGQSALEIGCCLGWSSCHLALGGVSLDAIDPMLKEKWFLEWITDSLAGAGVLPAINLVAGTSPDKVHELAARGQRKWALFFIDGNHYAPHPLDDTKACEAYATPNAIILYHDLAFPDVALGLDYLQEQGWQTVVYQTMQIMGAAWRGNAKPVKHLPDPTIRWPLPDHLRRHPVSGWNKDDPEGKNG